MDHTADGHEPVIREEEAIQHPLGVYFKIWTLLFVLSVLCRGLLSGTRLPALVPDPVLYGAESWPDYCRLYAHGVGAAGDGVLHFVTANTAVNAGGHRLIRGRLDVFPARCVPLERVNYRGPCGSAASLTQSA